MVSKPSHGAVLIRDLMGLRHRLSTDAVHLRAAMDWLCRAQDITGCGGVSAGYYFTSGWLPPYPETTGYIICTFLDYASLTGDGTWVDRAVRMGDWECQIQLPDGAVRGQIGINAFPVVFNTGQVIQGWVALYRHTGEARYLDAAVRAAHWLVRVQDEDGKWTKHEHAGVPHAYQTRVAWPMLQLASVTGRVEHRTAAERLVRWVLSNVEPNGWIRHTGFSAGQKPFTHTLAYTLEGLIESAAFLADELQREARQVVLRAAEKLLMVFELAKSDPRGLPKDLPGSFDERWKPVGCYTCLTGSAQLAIVWLKLHAITHDVRFVNAALKLVDQVKSTQRLRSSHPGIRGGVAGSYPMWGGYERFGYPNWAAKFLADALMLQERVMEPLEGGAI